MVGLRYGTIRDYIEDKIDSEKEAFNNRYTAVQVAGWANLNEVRDIAIWLTMSGLSFKRKGRIAQDMSGRGPIFSYSASLLIISLLMNRSGILQLRLHNQQLMRHAFTTPGEVVDWFGAIQAQDYFGAKWAIGLRLRGVSDSDVERAIDAGQIIRTWAMRRTLHFVSPLDVRWLLALCSPRILARSATLYRHLELDEKLFSKCKDLFGNALGGGNVLTRNEMYAILEKAKITTGGLRGLHILCHLAVAGIICFSVRRGKQPTFALLEEWVPLTKTCSVEEALAMLTKKYFLSHGPATVHDFSWWSGLTVSEAKRGISMISEELQNQTVDGQQYWMSDKVSFEKVGAQGAYLLPPFDEYLVAYKDRSVAIEAAFNKNIFGANGIFSAVILINNKVGGTWRRTCKKDQLYLETHLFRPASQARNAAVARAAKQYAKFSEKKAVIVQKHGFA